MRAVPFSLQLLKTNPEKTGSRVQSVKTTNRQQPTYRSPIPAVKPSNNNQDSPGLMREEHRPELNCSLGHNPLDVQIFLLGYRLSYSRPGVKLTLTYTCRSWKGESRLPIGLPGAFLYRFSPFLIVQLQQRAAHEADLDGVGILLQDQHAAVLP